MGGEDGGGRAGGEAREGFGHALAGFIYFLKHLQKGLGMPGAVCVLEAAGVMWAVRARGGSGHALAAFQYSLNTYKRV